MKYSAAKWVSALAHRAGATRVLGDLSHAGGCVITLHSIVPESDPLPLENNHISERFLASLLTHYAGIGVPIVSLDEGLTLTRQDAHTPWVSFTFDDGYRDNVQLGIPIFRKYGAPMTIFVTSAALDRTMDSYWWGQLRQVVLLRDVIVGDEIGGKLVASTAREKILAYKSIAKSIRSGALTVEQAEDLFERNGVSRTSALDRDCMTAAELGDLDVEAHRVTIGGHSTGHVPLTRLSEAAVAADVAANRERLSVLTGEEIRYFAYPFGDAASCSEREFAIVEGLGFSAAFTTRGGNIGRAAESRRWSLPRRKAIGPVETIGFLECQRSGLAEIVKRAKH